jgi:glutamyl/glutaminyl-tRNA synthetase
MGWLFARHERGAFLLHLDGMAASDVDRLCRDLAWLGIDWDEAPSTVERYRSLCQHCARQLGERGIADDALLSSSLTRVVAAHERGITHLFCDRSALADSRRQRLLCEALGWDPPHYVHLPSIVDADRDTCAVAKWTVANLRREGYLPLAVANQLARLGWTPRGKRALLSLEALIERFDLDRIQTRPVVYDERQLDWFGRRALSEHPLPKVAQLMAPFWQEAYGLAHRAAGTELDPADWQCLLASAIRDEVHFMAECVAKARFALSDTVRYDERARMVLSEPYAVPILEAFEAGMARVAPFTFVPIDRFVSELRWEFKASCDIRSRDVMHVIRAALTGRVDGPCLIEACQLLGRWRCIERSRSARLECCCA